MSSGSKAPEWYSFIINFLSPRLIFIYLVLYLGNGAPTIFKIADFGISRTVQPTEVGLKNITVDCGGTPAYYAPEVITKKEYGKPTDIWGFGCIMLYLAVGEETLFDWSKNARMTQRTELPPLPSDAQCLTQLLLKTLQLDPAKRPKAAGLSKTLEKQVEYERRASGNEGLHLIIFKATPLFPQDSCHWALYLPDMDHARGRIYTVMQASLRSKHTMCSTHPFHANKLTSRSVKAIVALPELRLTNDNTWLACQEVGRGWHFNLFSSNCQHWVCEVIKYLEDDSNIARRTSAIEMLKELGHVPWRKTAETYCS